MRADELRASYVKFFVDKGHVHRPSDSLVPTDDPTLLFTGAGMNQFKEMFLGRGRLAFTRAVTCQKCLRTGDIGNVGVTPAHQTFFEMLGNFSFGDYFKREAITWAWEFVTVVLGIPKERLRVSVYEKDQESYDIWKNEVGVKPEWIFRYGEHDNFWPADAPTKGPNGPCGPCSEIFVDLGPEFGCGKPTCGPACECRRFVEIWNLVFTQFDRKDGGKLEPLPNKNIDTGMGFERVLAVLAGKPNNFETELFWPIIEEIAAACGKKYERKTDVGRRMRRIADHVRAVTFCIADGVLPSNEGRGYVVRKLERIATNDGKQLGISETFLYKLVPTVSAIMGTAYPEVKERREYIARVVKAEELKYRQTLKGGLLSLEALCSRKETWGSTAEELVLALKAPGGSSWRAEAEKVLKEYHGEQAYHRDVLPTILHKSPSDVDNALILALSRIPILTGKECFELYDTYGLPPETAVNETKLIPSSNWEEEFAVEMSRQREQARKGSKLTGDIFVGGGLGKLRETVPATKFLGYETTQESCTVQAIISDDDLAESAGANPEKEITVILDQSPFYPEQGGQLGDTGRLSGKDVEFEVINTLTSEGHILHIGKLKRGSLKKGTQLRAEVNAGRREDIRRNHTATHLLHAALRDVVGGHAEQSGSLVGPDHFRFDFTHFEGLKREQLRTIEDLVNQKIREDLSLKTEVMETAQAMKTGAKALFGEKYGDKVRVVHIGQFSKELCGGTHCESTGSIGVFHIVSEESVAAGVRRITAVTGREALAMWRRQNDLIEEVAKVLGAPVRDLGKRAESLMAESKEMKKEMEKLKSGRNADATAELLAKAPEVGGVKIVVALMEEIEAKDLRTAMDRVRKSGGEVAALLAVISGDKVALVAGMTPGAIKKGLGADKLLKEVAGLVGGGSGGRAEMAQAGGSKPDMTKEALELARKVLTEALQGK